MISRRLLLAVGGASIAAPGLARAQGVKLGERAIGKDDAPVVVMEFFSLTCPHCAAFSRETMPQVRKNLIDTGKLRMVFHDFPLDQLALSAAAVARTLPPERYEPFVTALFAAQDRWVYARGINNMDELFKFAALAGMSREAFDKAANDQALKTAILAQQDADTKTYGIDSTPTFVFNGPNAKNQREAGARTYPDFAQLVAKAAG